MRAGEVDYSPLSRRPSEEVLAAVRAEALAGAFGTQTAEHLRTAKSRGWTLLVIVGGFTTGILAVTTLIQWLSGEDGGDVVVGLVATALATAMCFAIYAIGRVVVGPQAWRRDVRLILFGRSNGLHVEPLAEDRTLPGTLGERLGQHRSTWDRVTWQQDGRSVEVALYRENPYGSRTKSTFFCPYVAIRLPRSLPRMTFLSRTHVAVAPSVSFGHDVLPDAYPRLHRRRVRLVTAPADAAVGRRVFTDELIATLADQAHPGNAEVRGEWFLIYYHLGRPKVDEQTWCSTMRAVELVTRSVGAVVAVDPAKLP